MSKPRIIVIGGGAAGLMAAGQAAENGADTLLLEKQKKTGQKLGITGKGRCNLTNTAQISDFIAHFGKTGPFMRQAFARFFSTDLAEFFEKQGLKLVTERGGRVFPASGRAADVLSVFMQWLKQCSVTIKRDSPVDKLLINNKRVCGVISRGRAFTCDAVILATGGASYPATGSTGDGYRLARSAGHSLVPVRPALVPLETKGDIAQKMAGLNLRNIRVRMYINRKKRTRAFGELVFTEFGVSGPVILTLSGEAVDALGSGHGIVLSIDLKPALDEKKLDMRILRDFQTRGKEPFKSFLRGLLPREMVPVCMDLTGISPERMVSSISAVERRGLRTWLKDFRLEVTGHRPLAEAIVTAGGIDTREIDPRTMESRICRGLYIAGELLDIQADTGGYNLQAAFSTGHLAGRCAASESRRRKPENTLATDSRR